jgi:hypothetical protein
MIAQLTRSVRMWWRREYQSSPGREEPPGRLRPSLAQLAQMAEALWPDFVRESAAARKYIALLGGLDWAHFPDRHGGQKRRGPRPLPDAPVVAAFLVKLDKGLKSMKDLRDYLVEQPALTWALGFRLVASTAVSYGFDVQASLPTHRHFSRLLRKLPNAQMQFLLSGTVQLLEQALPDECALGDEISLDTKHILAWVRENNPKEFIKGGRFHKERQPKGDKDCKVGFKATENGPAKPTSQPAEAVAATQATPAPDSVPAAPTTHGLPASAPRPKPKAGEYYWGYASGVVATKVEGWGEVVLAELTQTFDHADETYFHPLIAQTERNLGRKPRCGALDGAYDTFYVHEYFTLAGGFAAVPWADRADHKKSFSPDRLPLCDAGLPMPLKGKVNKQSGCLVPHEIGRYGCPLLFPHKTGETCPIGHKNWLRPGKDQGCLTTLPTSAGAFARHTLDRDSDEYKRLYDQRTAVERINSQAVALGIERPHLRNQQSITNLNTVLYVLINLRALQRIKEKTALMPPND